MKDLYKSLGVSPNATDEQIRQAIAQTTSADIRTDAICVLTNPSRRRIYDRNFVVLKTVGRLRANLGLNNGENWRQRDFSDFTFPETTAATKGKVIGKISVIIATTVYWFRIAIFVLFFAAIAGLFIKACFFNDSSHQPMTPYTPGGNSRTQSGQPSASLTTPNNQQPQSQGMTNTQPQQGSPAISPAVAANVPSYPEQPLPTHGQTFFKGFRSGSGTVTFNPSGASDVYCYVKIVNENTQQSMLEFFLMPGRILTVNLPTGLYRLKFASGSKWYGTQYLFGPGTSVFKDDSTFDIQDAYVTYEDRVDGRYQVTHPASHWDITLKTTSGNSNLVPIPLNQF